MGILLAASVLFWICHGALLASGVVIFGKTFSTARRSKKQLILKPNHIFYQRAASGIDGNGSIREYICSLINERHGIASADGIAAGAHRDIAECELNRMVVGSIHKPVQRQIDLLN